MPRDNMRPLKYQQDPLNHPHIVIRIENHEYLVTQSTNCTGLIYLSSATLSLSFSVSHTHTRVREHINYMNTKDN